MYVYVHVKLYIMYIYTLYKICACMNILKAKISKHN